MSNNGDYRKQSEQKSESRHDDAWQLTGQADCTTVVTRGSRSRENQPRRFRSLRPAFIAGRGF
jgi:hypothetical protein